MERDKQQRQQLTEQGWSVLVVWEEDIKRKRTQEQQRYPAFANQQ